jgi:alpha-L-rhamnosidase
MNKTIYAWDGAQWIGSSENRLNAAAQSYFEISTKFKINKGNKMSLVLGANDFRFFDAFQNVESMNGEHYVRVELDFSTETTLNIYRVGFAPGDSADKPLYSVKKSSHPDTNLDELLPVSSKNQQHTLDVYVEYGQMYFVVDGKDLIVEKPRNFGWGGFAVGHTSKSFPKGTKLTVSPYGSGGNYNTVPHLGEIGFASEAGSEVVYTDYQVLDCGMSEDPITFDSNHIISSRI